MRANLFNLQKTNSMMEKTQLRLATGKAINSPLDDPTLFFSAEKHMQRASDLSSRKSEMGEAVQLINAGNKGIESVTSLLEAAKSLATSALSAESTAQINTLETQYGTVMSQLTDLAADSGYKGINLLGGTSETLDVKFDEDGTSKITLTGFSGNSTGLTLEEVSANEWNDDTTGGTADKDEINTAILKIETAIGALRDEASKLASNLTVITTRQDFTQGMIDTLKDGADNLVNADMNEEGANMLMLQTRQALGTTSLSLASQAAQSVLRLF